MASDLLAGLIEATGASFAAIVLVLLLRTRLRVAFGPGIAYGSWLLVPAALLSTLLPAQSLAIVAPTFAKPVAQAVAAGIAATAASPPEWTAWLLGAWLVGALLFALAQWRQQSAYVRSLGKLVPGDGVHVAEATSGCPAVVGVLRPRIILPADFATRYTAAEQALVLEHERLHLRRGDVIANALWAAAQSLFWFNPLIHLAARCARFDQELACDALVTAGRPQTRKPYAEAMLKTQMATTDLPLGCHWRASHPIKERIMSLNRLPPGKPRRFAGHLLVAVLTIGVGYSAWASQPPVARSPVADTAAKIEPGVMFQVLVTDGGKVVSQPAVAGRFDQPLSIRVDGLLSVQMSASAPDGEGWAQTSYRAQLLAGDPPGATFGQSMRARLTQTPSFEYDVPGTRVRLEIRPRLVDLAKLSQDEP